MAASTARQPHHRRCRRAGESGALGATYYTQRFDNPAWVMEYGAMRREGLELLNINDPPRLNDRSAVSDLKAQMNTPSRYVLALALLFPAAGMIDGFIARRGDQSPLTLFYAIAVAALLHRWCKADATLRGIEPPFGSAAMVAFLAPIGVPLYFFRTMPFASAAGATAKAIALAALVLAAYAFSRAVCTRP